MFQLAPIAISAHQEVVALIRRVSTSGRRMSEEQTSGELMRIPIFIVN
jgi:hypothetical protein